MKSVGYAAVREDDKGRKYIDPRTVGVIKEDVEERLEWTRSTQPAVEIVRVEVRRVK